MITRIGFIGLGVMGKPMARNLLKAGYTLTVHNRSIGPIEELVKAGAMVASSSKEAAEGAEVVITMLPDSADSERVILGENGVLDGAREGTVVIDMASVAPLVSQRIAAEAAKKNVHMLDAPVSGGEPGAIAGTLAIMVGGRQEVFEKCLPILSVMGKSVVRVGEVGAGNFVKLANQIIVAVNIAAIGEALRAGPKGGHRPGVGLSGHPRWPCREQRPGSQGSSHHGTRLHSRGPIDAPPEGPAQCAAYRQRPGSATAGHGLGATDAWGVNQQRAGRHGPFGHRDIRRRPGRYAGSEGVTRASNHRTKS